jgi:hypothetical protein
LRRLIENSSVAEYLIVLEGWLETQHCPDHPFFLLKRLNTALEKMDRPHELPR